MLSLKVAENTESSLTAGAAEDAVVISSQAAMKCSYVSSHVGESMFTGPAASQLRVKVSAGAMVRSDRLIVI